MTVGYHERSEPGSFLEPPHQVYEGEVPVPWAMLMRALGLVGAIADYFETLAELEARAAGDDDRPVARLGQEALDTADELAGILGNWEDDKRGVGIPDGPHIRVRLRGEMVLPEGWIEADHIRELATAKDPQAEVREILDEDPAHLLEQIAKRAGGRRPVDLVEVEVVVPKG